MKQSWRINLHNFDFFFSSSSLWLKSAGETVLDAIDGIGFQYQLMVRITRAIRARAAEPVLANVMAFGRDIEFKLKWWWRRSSKWNEKWIFQPFTYHISNKTMIIPVKIDWFPKTATIFLWNFCSFHCLVHKNAAHRMGFSGYSVFKRDDPPSIELNQNLFPIDFR